MTVTWDDLSSDEKLVLERLFTHDSFPVLPEVANRPVIHGLAAQKSRSIDISLAGETLVVQHTGRK